MKENIDKRNAYVKEHARAKPETGLKQLQQWAKRHKLSQFVTVSLEEHLLSLTIDEQAMERSALLDGCYTLETDVSTKLMDTATVAGRYLDLQQVERNFRTMKTGFLEVRPVFLRNAERT